MPRPIVGNRQNQQFQGTLSLNQKTAGSTQGRTMSKLERDRLLRKPRSKEYMEAIRKLDAGSHVHNRAQVEEIISILQKVSYDRIGRYFGRDCCEVLYRTGIRCTYVEPDRRDHSSLSEK